jgi:deoxyribonuclease-4
MSIAGGVDRAVGRAVLHGCEALQIFTKNGNRWKGPPLDAGAVLTFRRGIEAAGLTPAVSHASYLINLATTVPALRQLSLEAFLDELDRAEALGLLGVVLHPGTCTAGSETDAIRLVADAIRAACALRPAQRTAIILEHTAGQGRTLGYCFEHLADILEHLDGSPRVGVCLDTCHLAASGYDIVSERGYQDTFERFERLVGFDRLLVIHANDSKRPCGSRVDRHEHIGQGCLGEAPFRRMFQDARFAGRPMLIETEKSRGWERGTVLAPDPLDVRNLDTLRRLRQDVLVPA